MNRPCFLPARAAALFGAGFLALAVTLVCAHAAGGKRTGARASLVIHILDVSPKGGIMRLGVYDKTGYPDDKNPVASADVPAHPGETVIDFPDLRPGTYAIEAYQDINANDRMDQTWIGLPLEPYGFSRDATPILSKPGFARVSFVVKAGRNEQTLHLQNVDVSGS